MYLFLCPATDGFPGLQHRPLPVAEEGQNKDADTNKKISISISGGVFDSDVQAYAADGYKAIQVTGDKYVVTNKIALDKTSTRIRRGYTDTLKAIVEANGKTYDVADPITWASDKEAVATVENGVVTGVDYGTATITATLGTTTEAPDTTGTPATQAEGDEVTGGDAVTDGDNTPSNTLKASCTVTVFKKSSSGSSSGGGGGSSAAKHGVTISDSKNGAVTASAAKAETGDKVILTPKADEGYELDKITAKDKDGKEIKMTIGKVLEKYGVAPVIIGGRTFVPVRFVADELGAVTTWDDATKTVTIQAVK